MLVIPPFDERVSARYHLAIGLKQNRECLLKKFGQD